jgi:hypothetical protein
MTHHILVATDLTDESLAVLHAAKNVQVTTVTPTLAAVREKLRTRTPSSAAMILWWIRNCLTTRPNCVWWRA